MKSFVFALQLLTRIRILDLSFNEKALGRSTMFFPLVGLFLGGILVFIHRVAGEIFPPAAVAAAVVVALVMLTGGMHLDGFMDTVDGLFSGRPRERMLEIMKDSRAGSFGVVGVVCLLLFKFSLITGIAGVYDYMGLIMMTVTGRWGMTYATARFPYAREEGMGRLFTLHTGIPELAVASLTALVVSAVAGGLGGLIIFLSAGIFTHLLCMYMNKVLGGLTGDTYGAVNEVLEVFVLALYISLNRLAPILFP
ncbi:MAG: adenosylcobinamide-GDP ribazoletransferase [Bacillota bacterium]